MRELLETLEVKDISIWFINCIKILFLGTKQGDSFKSIGFFWGEILVVRNMWEALGKYLVSENHWVIVQG